MTREPATIPEALALRETSGRGIAFLGEEGETARWTFGDLADVARRAAGAWRDIGVAPGDRVGLLGSTSPDLVAAIFGCWALGAVAVPLAVPLRITSPEALVDEISSRAAKAQISVLGADPVIGALVPLDGIAPRFVGIDRLRDGSPAPLADVDPDSPALIQFTSGSTARPKGVALSHRTLIENGRSVRDHVGLSTDDVCVSWLPLYHDFGLIGLTLWPLVLDMATHLLPPETFIASPKRWVHALSNYRATVTAAPNFAFGLAARALKLIEGEIDLSALRVAANGAEPVDNETMDGFIAAAGPRGFRREALLGVYGLAEATLGVSSPPTLNPPSPWWVDGVRLAGEGMAEDIDPTKPGARPLVSVGNAIPGVEIAICSDAGDRLPDGTVGEIWIRSDFAMLGYWDDPGETARVLVDGWIRTGDLGVSGPDGLYVTGRVKDMIIVGGRNLYPEDAERAAASVPGVRKGNAVAFGIVRPRRSEAKAQKAREGLVVIAETRLVGEEAARLAKQIATEVRKVMRLAADHVVLLVPGSLPKTPSGKLQRALTRKLYEAEQLVSKAVATAGRALHGGSPEPAY
ncbi:MAG TPA: AMP-binding protein [Actinomycetota bacterium]|jgi:fatty-acyl-CoA synthase|nr:AMP-binding protein [Actinomycetota bacterium]